MQNKGIKNRPSRADFHSSPTGAGQRRLVQQGQGIRVGKAMCHGHFLAGEFALHHVEPVQQVGIVQQCLTIPLLGQLDNKGEGGIVERHGRGAGHRPRHVGDTVVHNLIDNIGRILVGGGVGGFHTAA